MITIHGKTLGNFTAIYHIALGLEHRFPNNNGPFAYGTRLCEEIGELVDALQATNGNTLTAETRHHLVKEIQDVLQIVAGTLGLYHLIDQFPADIKSFYTNPTLGASKGTIIQLAVHAGLFADAINHMESQGVKRQKHGPYSHERLLGEARRLTATIAGFIQAYELLKDLEDQIIADYHALTERGFITPIP